MDDVFKVTDDCDWDSLDEEVEELELDESFVGFSDIEDMLDEEDKITLKELLTDPD